MCHGPNRPENLVLWPKCRPGNIESRSVIASIPITDPSLVRSIESQDDVEGVGVRILRRMAEPKKKGKLAGQLRLGK